MVFSMNPNLAPGPDGFGGDILGLLGHYIRVLNVVQDFLCGYFMPKFISHACLVLLPKVEHPNNFS